MDDPLRRAVEEAVAWLDSEQDERAVLLHHGISKDVGDYIVSMAPVGWAEHPVLIFSHKHESSYPAFERLEIDRITAIVNSVSEVLSYWNGVAYTTYSVALKRYAGEGLLRAVRNYHGAGSRIFDRGWLGQQIFATRPNGWR